MKEGLVGIKLHQGSYTNFSGLEKKTPDGRLVNSAGARNFCAFLSEDQANEFLAKGYNVRYTKITEEMRESGESPWPYVTIKINDKGKYPIDIWLIPGRKNDSGEVVPRTKEHWVKIETEQQFAKMDGFQFDHADLTVSTYNYISPRTGEPGVSMYLQEGYFIYVPDRISALYDNVPLTDADIDAEPNIKLIIF